MREIRRVLVPHDCLGLAFWARSDAYIEPVVQAGMSWLALLPQHARRRGSAQLADDLASGAWDQRYGHLRELTLYNGGYRIAIAE